MGSPFTITSVSNYNSNPPSDDGSQTAANRVQWSTQKQKLADPIKTAFDASETNTSSAFGKVLGGGGITTTAVNYTISASDQGKFIKGTASSITITTPDATVVGSPFVCVVVNDSSGDITFDGNGAQTIDGVSGITLHAGTGVIINTDGSNWFTGGQNFVLTSIAQAGTGISFNTGTSPPTISATAGPSLIPNYISGLTLSTAGGSGTMSIAAGVANDSTNSTLMRLASAISKTTASWAVGSGNGGLDTGAIAASTWYHFYEIERPDTGVVDVCFSLSASAPTTGGAIPAAYTLFRRIGTMKTDGSNHWIAFTQTGDEFIWATSVTDVNNISCVASRVNKVLTVPTGIVVKAMFRGAGSAGGASGNTVLFTSLQETDQAPATGGLGDLFIPVSSTVAGDFERWTDTSAQIGVRASSAVNSYSIFTYGWKDTRGK